MHFWRPAVITVSILVSALVTPAAAQQGGRPAEGNGKAIRDKFSSLLSDDGQLQRLTGNLERLCLDANGVDTCESTSVGRKFKDMVRKAARTRERAKGAQARTDDSDFQEFTRRRPKPVVASLDALAVEADPRPPLYDEEAGKDVIEDANDIEADVADLNAILESRPPPVTPTDAQYSFPGELCVHPHIRLTALIGARAARVVSDVSRAGCNQTFVVVGNGGNVSTACMPMYYVAAFLEATVDSLNFVCSENSSSEITATYFNSKNVINGLNQATEGLSEMLVALGKNQELIIKNQNTIMQLLRTPQGLRLDFPVIPK